MLVRTREGASMRLRRRAGVVAALGVALAGATGCSLIGDLTGGGGLDVDVAALVLHPTGDPGLWLDPGYAAGVAGSWEVPGLLCGATATVVAVSGDEGITGYDATTGEQVWQAPGWTCSTEQEVAGDLYLVGYTANGSELAQLDIDTGEVQVFYSAEIMIYTVTAVARGEDSIYLHADADVGPAMMSFALDGTMQWQAPIETSWWCTLMGTHVVCSSGPAFTALDAATGEVTIPETPIPDGSEAIWTTGGYTITSMGITMDVETTTVYDYDGAEIGSVDDAGVPSTIMMGERGALYSVEDLMTDGVRYVWLTDAEGKPVVHLDGEFRFTATGEPLPEGALLHAAAADGSTVLYGDTAGSAALMATDGSPLHTFDAALTIPVVYGGRIMGTSYGTDMTTTVFLPAG